MPRPGVAASGVHRPRLVLLAALALISAPLGCHADTIYIEGDPITHVSGGVPLTLATLCSNSAPVTPFCARVNSKSNNGLNVRVSGIPLNCNSAGSCSITAPTAVCASSVAGDETLCQTNTLTRRVRLINACPDPGTDIDAGDFVDRAVAPVPTNQPFSVPGYDSLPGITYRMGNYTIRYRTASDANPTCLWEDTTAAQIAARNALGLSSCERLVIVEDTNVPQVSLCGNSVMELEGGDEFIDPGATGTDTVDGDLLYLGAECDIQVEDDGSITFLGNPGDICRLIPDGDFVDGRLVLNNKDVKNLTITYVALDRVSTSPGTVSRLLIVKDTKPPLINLCGPQRITVEAGEQYVDTYCGVQPENNVCLEPQDGGSLNDAQAKAYCEARASSGCQWINDACILTTHPCFDHLSENECTANALCRWCPRGATAEDIVDGDLTASMFVNSEVDMRPSILPATFTIRYSVEDNNGVSARQVVRYVTVDDSKAPDLQLVGNATINLEGASFFYDPWAIATDEYYGDLSNDVSLISVRQAGNCIKSTGCGLTNFNAVTSMAPAGTRWTLKYSVRDPSGRQDTQSRKDRVVVIVDTQPPVLTLTTTDTCGEFCTWEGATTWIDPGATAYDALDQNDLNGFTYSGVTRPSRVNSAGRVDTGAPAFSTFTVVYSVRDMAFNEAEPINRTVMIVDSTIPVINGGALTAAAQASQGYVDPNITARDSLDGAYAYSPRPASRIFRSITRVPVTCAADEFESQAETRIRRRVCTDLTVCTAEQYQVQAPTPTTDRACINVTGPCALGDDYEVAAPTATSDRQCITCPSNSTSAATTVVETPREFPCFNFSAPVVTEIVDLLSVLSTTTLLPTTLGANATTGLPGPASNATDPIRVYAFVNDTLRIDFDASLREIVSVDGTINSSVIYNVSDPATLDALYPIVELRIPLVNATVLELYDAFDPTVVILVDVRDRPTLDACNLNASGLLLNGSKTLLAAQAIYDAAYLRFRQDYRVALASQEEDTLGRCQILNMHDMATILFEHQYETVSVGLRPAMPSRLAFLGANQSNGRFEYRLPGASDWIALGSNFPRLVPTGSAAAPTNFRFYGDADYHGTVLVVWALASDATGAAGAYHATGSLEVEAINDAPILEDGIVAPYMFEDEDPPADIGRSKGFAAIDLLRIDTNPLPNVVEYQYFVTDVDTNLIVNGTMGVAVVGLFQSEGVWSWTCDTRGLGANDVLAASADDWSWFFFDGGYDTVLQRQVTEPSSTFATLLAHDCRIRYQPNPNFNTEINAAGEYLPASIKPYLLVRAWDMSNGEDLAGLSGADTSTYYHTGPYSQHIATAAMDVYQSGDLPNILLTEDGGDYATTFLEGNVQGVLLVNDSYVGLNYLDGISIEEITVTLTNRLDGDAERIVVNVDDSPLTAETIATADTSTIRIYSPTNERHPLTIFAAVLPTLRYFNDADEPNPTARVINFQARDEDRLGEISTTEVRVQLADDPPQVDFGSNAYEAFMLYEDLGSPVTLAPSAVIDDADSTVLRAATVSVSSVIDYEWLLFNESFLPVNLTVERAGPATLVFRPRNATVLPLAFFQAALRRVEYVFPLANVSTNTTGDDDDDVFGNATTTTAAPVVLPTALNQARTINFVLQDETSEGASPVYLSTASIGLPPIIDLNGKAPGRNNLRPHRFVEGGQAVHIFNEDMYVSDSSNSQQLLGAQVYAEASANCGQEVLAWDAALASSSGISVVHNSLAPILTLSGTATIAQYVALLQTITYANQAEAFDGGLRYIYVTVTDTEQFQSPAAMTTVRLIDINDNPVLYPDQGVEALAVRQDAQEDTNTGFSPATLMARKAPALLTRPRIQQIGCGADGQAGCTWWEAASTCRNVALTLCSAAEVRASWPNATSGAATVGWTNTLASASEVPAFAGLVANTVSRSNLSIFEDVRPNPTYAYILRSYNLASEPLFGVAERSESLLGEPVYALCCRLPQAAKQAPAILPRADLPVDAHLNLTAGRIHPISSIKLEAEAHLMGKGISGHIYFEQLTADAPVSVRVNIEDLNVNSNAMYKLAIYAQPVGPASVAEPCGRSYVGRMYDPLTIGSTCAADDATLCAMGNISGRHGAFDEVQYQQGLLDHTLSLFSAHSVVGRSVVLLQNDVPLTCGNITWAATVPTRRVRASFDGYLSGTVTLTQPSAAAGLEPSATAYPLTPTTVQVALRAPIAQISAISWFVADESYNASACAAATTVAGPGPWRPVTHLSGDFTATVPAFTESEYAYDAPSGSATLLIASERRLSCLRMTLRDDSLRLLADGMWAQLVAGSCAGTGSSAVLLQAKVSCNANGTCEALACFDDVVLSTSSSYAVRLHANFSEPSAAVCAELAQSSSTQPCADLVAGQPLGSVLCDVGALSEKHGNLVIDSSSTARSVFQDPDLPLRGSASVSGKTLVLQVGSTVQCAPLLVEAPMPRVAEAYFDLGNVRGLVTFTQDGPTNPVSVSAEMYVASGSWTYTNAGLRVVETAVATLADGAGLSTAMCADTGDVFAPTGAGTGSCSQSVPSACAAGDLRGKHGSFSTPVYNSDIGKYVASMSLVDNDITLFGQHSIVGRALALVNSGTAKISCANIRATGPYDTISAKLHGSVAGVAHFSRPRFWTTDEVFVTLDLTQRVSGGSVAWSLNEANGDCGCAQARDVWAQTGAAECTPGQDATHTTCGYGDMSGKHGYLTSLTRGRHRYSFTDMNLPWTELAGKSIVVYNDFAASSRVACGTLTPLQDRVAYGVVVQSGITVNVTMSQNGPMAPLQIKLDAYDLAGIDRLQILQAGALAQANADDVVELTCSTGGNMYNPFAKATCSSLRFQSDDNCAIGDFSGRFTTAEDLVEMQHVYTDRFLSLYGPATVAGRAFTLLGSAILAAPYEAYRNKPFVCANLRPAATVAGGDPAFVTQPGAHAVFDDAEAPFTGEVVFEPLYDDVLSELQISVRLSLTDASILTAWYIGDATSCDNPASLTTVFNPDEINAASICGTYDAQLGCAAGDLTSKHGTPSGSVFGQFVDRELVLDGARGIMNRVLVLQYSAASTGSATRLCAPIVPHGRSVVTDPDDTSMDAHYDLGLAIIGLNDDHGYWQYRESALEDTWTNLSVAAVTRRNALHFAYSIIPRLRFVPEAGFAGDENCETCPIPRAKSCVPCALNMTAGGVSFVGWDLSNGDYDGQFLDLSAASTAAYSTASKFMTVEIELTRVNESVPAGTQYYIDFSVRDNVGNQNQFQRQLTIVDLVPPTVAVRGQASSTWEGGFVYVDPGATALDGQDLDITGDVRVSSIALVSGPLAPEPEDSPRLFDCTLPASNWPVVGDELQCRSRPNVRPSYYSFSCVVPGPNVTLPYQPGVQVALTGLGQPVGMKDIVSVENKTYPCVRSGTGLRCYEASSEELELDMPTGIQDVTLSCAVEVTVPYCLLDDYRLAVRHPRPTDPRFVNTAVSAGTTYRIGYTATDATSNEASETYRTVTIEDTIAPQVRVLSQRVTLNKVRGGSETYTYVEPDVINEVDCPGLALTDFEAWELPYLACSYALDILDGDVSCRSSVTLYNLNAVTNGTLARLAHAAFVLWEADAAAAGATEAFEVLTVANNCLLFNAATRGLLSTAAGAAATAGASAAASVAEQRLVDARQTAAELAAAVNDSFCGSEAQASVLGTLNPSAPVGSSYFLLYSTADLNGNTREFQRLVTVADWAAPNVTVASDPNITLAYLANWTEADALVGVTAVDGVDGNLTANLTVLTLPNTAVPGVYNVTFSVTDSSGNTNDWVYRTVLVLAAPTRELEDNQVEVSATYLLSNVAPTTFNTAEGHRAFYAAILELFLTNQYYDFTTFINASSFFDLKAVDYAQTSNDDSLVTIRVVVPCNRAANTTIAFGNFSSQGSLAIRLRAASAIFRNLRLSMNSDPVTTGSTCPPVNVAASGSGRLSTGAAIGLGVGIFVLLFVVVFVIWWFKCRRDKEDEMSRLLAGMHDPAPKPEDNAKYHYINGVLVRIDETEYKDDKVVVEEEDIYDNTKLNKKPRAVPVPPSQGALAFTPSAEETYEGVASPSGTRVNNAGGSSSSTTFMLSGEETYEGVDSRTGFNTHNNTSSTDEQGGYLDIGDERGNIRHMPYERTGELAAATEELYLAQGKIEPAPAPQPVPLPVPMEEDTYDTVAEPKAAPVIAPFVHTAEDVYDGVETVKPGFASHDRSERTGELAAATEELYLAQGKIEPAPAPQPVPLPVPMEEDTYDTVAEPKAAPVIAPFVHTAEDVYDGVEVTKPGFASHDRSERTGELAAATEELYLAQGKIDAPPTTMSSFGGVGGTDDVAEPKAAPVIAPFVHTAEDVYDGVEVTKPGFASHDRSERTGELAAATEELYLAQGKIDAPPTTMSSFGGVGGTDDVYEDMATAHTPRGQVPTGFQMSTDDIYEGVEDAKPGFAAHDRTERSGELAALTEELYEVQGQDRGAGPSLPPMPSRPPAAVQHWSQDTRRYVHGALSRTEADSMLTRAGGEAGTFLVRARKGTQQYVLSLALSGGKGEHHVLERGPTGAWQINGSATTKPCTTLEALVQHLSQTADIVGHTLTQPVSPA
ncbi:uncharacterized protein MONBRDRAFT_33987 [Monosiga brevicollis MX1]|uniref:SH2 domain-containing protein n=1 Tax=Monosiga brevicollis TaxID=81824 RepID=A9V8Y3_MONBE|nr:uncharacterized protein MONBRDRAFT_33987 [Monosiga brevicollis MX1]EDQ86038.1 predicted protein [Monosiga brevicollis MX1]|eukprot:XP_001749232.1 hypothetical protein [Monosiga brevicollis MX1]